MNNVLKKDIFYKETAKEIAKRQGAPWYDGRINDSGPFPYIRELFQHINTNDIDEPWVYQGRIYRIHTPYSTFKNSIDSTKGKIIRKISPDGSCRYLPNTEYTEKPVSFSKSPDFTKAVYNKVYPSERCNFLVCDTYTLKGIDVNKFMKEYGNFNERLEEEQEILFPIYKKNIIKEYTCTPNQFKNYMKKISKINPFYAC